MRDPNRTLSFAPAMEEEDLGVLGSVMEDESDDGGVARVGSASQLSNCAHATRVASLTVEDEETVRRQCEQRANGVLTRGC